MEHANELFKERVRAGSRTYFLDVKETCEGKPYLSIQESRKKGDSFERSRLLIFQDHIDDFMKGLHSVQSFVANHPSSGGTEKSNSNRQTVEPPPPLDEKELPF
ncbi:MAG: DUF3276 family protein [Candidatus Omnitrophica bacterium]|nr:DUF3276 family protein [Candidatus Omnitrophota bacterium]